jgi:predicted membrane chloride channel (bestrophin family)
MQNPVIDAVRNAESKVFNFTHFSVLVAVVVYCSGGNQLLVITSYALVMVAVLALLCFRLYTGYCNARRELFSLEADNRDKERLAFELEKVSNREREYARAFKSIKESMECCITMDVPSNPVITTMGYVFSRKELGRFTSTMGYLICPISGRTMIQSDIMCNYPVVNVCAELRHLDSVLTV